MLETVARGSRCVYFVSVTHFFAPERFEGPGFVLRSHDAGDGPLLADAANELSWRCDSKNAASVRVAEKCGLLHEGVLRGQAAHVGDGRRDTTCYALTKPDWLAR